MLFNLYVGVIDIQCVSKPPLPSDLVTRTRLATDTFKTCLLHTTTRFETARRVLDLSFSDRVGGQDVGLRKCHGKFSEVKCQNRYYIEKHDEGVIIQRVLSVLDALK